MAFHVACPITCQRICFCTFGFRQKLQSEKGRKDFLDEVFRVEEFLNDPWSVRARQKDTVQVSVPRIVVASTPVVTVVADGVVGGEGDVEEMSAQTKRVALQKKAVAESLAAEDYARRFETGDLADASKETGQDIVAEEQGSSTINVMCRLCFYGENEGSERALRMLACKICSKKYHRNCLKSWAQHRDIFHWSSWACPSCRTCEICRRTGDPNKFMFCKRCDGAYHCYCQQPPHKNVSAGPYLCLKHTRCHSCGSNVSGSGLSTRWFLGYTCCDACGRLFVKGKYCPVCLKVYRDSESTPMVCCDACQRWVHCDCDGISDEKYLQFQADKNLYYKCAACRGDCYQVKDLDDAVQELWRRRDEADRDLIASLRAAAGLPSQEEIFSISLYSDDEENGPTGRSLKFSVKGLADKTPKNTKEYGKKSLNRKYAKKKGFQVSSIGKTEAHHSFERQLDLQSFECDGDDEKIDQMLSHRSGGPDVSTSPLAGVPFNTKRKLAINQSGTMRPNPSEEVVNNEERASSSRVIQIKSRKSHGLDVMEGTVKQVSKPENVKGTKLVIHLGSRNRNVSNSPRSKASSCHKEQELTTASNGSEDTSQLKASDKKYMVDEHDGIDRYGDTKGEKHDTPDELKGSKRRGRDHSLIKLGKVEPDVSNLKPIAGEGKIAEGYESTGAIRTRVLLGKRSTERSVATLEPLNEASTLRDVVPARKQQSKGTPNKRDERQNLSAVTSTVSDSLPKDPKPLLKLKFKNPYFENRSSWTPKGEEEKSSVKGQRSKRKRPSPLMDKGLIREDGGMPQYHQDNPIDEAIDANWILKKLGKDAIGKRVEVHQPSGNSWHRGIVTDVVDATSTLAVRLEDGRDKTFELGKQGVRFVSQKQKRSKV
ncbi:uncharacterized protein LOC122089859 [Macadamia integrifolia]|uniref:uncharacterized protein LOC122089859 n=1 Tax=Macadamia integrifolia TaxID=60698 RepID=UPI001C4F2580|nr:uncharacterized protein LOC122089859 [Macadamia integrifolia]